MALSLNEITYNILKRDIMTFKYKPGDVISAQRVADSYNVSRTPAREAIVMLANEGLLQIYPKSGSKVSKINLNRASQEWFVRMNLEVGMVDDFLRNCDDKVIEKLENHVKLLEECRTSEDICKRIILDNEFHGIIYECSKQYLAKEIIDTKMSHYNRLRYLAETDKKVQLTTDTEHEKLIKAAKEKNKDVYVRMIKKHMSRIENDKIQLFKDFPQYFEN